MRKKEEVCQHRQQHVFHLWGHSLVRAQWGGVPCQERPRRHYILGRNHASVLPRCEGGSHRLPLILGAAWPACCLRCTADFPLAHLPRGHAEAALPSLWRLLTGRAQRTLFSVYLHPKGRSTSGWCFWIPHWNPVLNLLETKKPRLAPKKINGKSLQMTKGKRATPKQMSILISPTKWKVHTAFDSFSTNTNTHFSLCLESVKRGNIILLYCIQTFRIPAKYLFWIAPVSNSSFYQ